MLRSSNKRTTKKNYMEKYLEEEGKKIKSISSDSGMSR